MTQNKTKQINEIDKKKHWVDILHGPMAAWSILIISLIITLIAWNISNDYAEQRAKERFEFQIEEAQDAIQKRFINYEQVLRGGLGFFVGSDHVRREEWRDYISILELEKFFPGTLGVGYSQWLKPEELAAHIDEIKQQGFPQFVVRPEGERDHYSSITLLEPFNQRNQKAFGYDMYSEPVRREAMERARDTGKTALSGKVTLVQESSSGIQAGILIYVPHYRENVTDINERRDALMGFVYSALRVGDLMQGILGVGLPELDFSLYDGNSNQVENKLYESRTGQSGHQPAYKRQETLEIGGRVWAIEYESNAAFASATSSNQPTLVAVGGIIIDFLLFNIILALGRSRKQAQKLADDRMAKLRARELEFKAITDNANDGIISINENGTMNYLNHSAQQMFNYAKDEVINKPIALLFPAKEKNTIETILNNKTANNKAAGLIEIEGIGKGNKVFPVEFSLACWESGGKLGYTAIVRDITERKKVEQLKKEFISTVSHELRTPLAAISGSLSLIENGVVGDITEKMKTLVDNANRNTVRLAKLVNDLLDSEKMAAGAMQYDMEDCEIKSLVEKALDMNRAVAIQSNISLILAEGAESAIIHVDPERFIQVMTNLLANAIKFSSNDDFIETQVNVENDQVRVAVIDHGAGVPDKFRDKIFGKFSQADSSDTRKHGGTGLGLNITKVIIEKFNGKIDYSSVPNKETTFFFTLPVVNPLHF